MVKNATRPAMFKWRQTAPELILCAVRWYLRCSLSLRDVEEWKCSSNNRKTELGSLAVDSIVARVRMPVPSQ